MNLSVTSPYNADFDGDEMNLHVPQVTTLYSIYYIMYYSMLYCVVYYEGLLLGSIHSSLVCMQVLIGVHSTRCFGDIQKHRTLRRTVLQQHAQKKLSTNAVNISSAAVSC
jgi:RNA polymerase Rpb1, domain 2